jgi:hypothetical protein
MKWATAQVVTVTAVNDTAVEGTHFGTITHTASSSDTAYNAIAVASVTATITDNDGTPTTTNLRVVSYNIASEFGTVRTGLSTLLQGMGSEIVAGFARQVDLIALQEVDLVQTATSFVSSLLNAIYGTGIYVSGTLAGLTTGAGTQGVVYNSQTLQLLVVRVRLGKLCDIIFSRSVAGPTPIFMSITAIGNPLIIRPTKLEGWSRSNQSELMRMLWVTGKTSFTWAISTSTGVLNRASKRSLVPVMAKHLTPSTALETGAVIPASETSSRRPHRPILLAVSLAVV